MTVRKYAGLGLLSTALLICSSSQIAQSAGYAVPYPRPGVIKLRDTDNVTFWEVLREKGKPSPMFQLPLDQLEVTMIEGVAKFTKPDGTWTVERQGWGTVRLLSKGTIIQEEGLSDFPSRVVVFQLKEFPSRTRKAIDGIPGQFPRIGAVKLFENGRINVWDQVFLPNRPVTNHLHYTEIAAIFLQGGKLRSRDLGKPINAPFERYSGELMGGSVGDMSLVPHEEEVVEGNPRVIFVEFK